MSDTILTVNERSVLNVRELRLESPNGEVSILLSVADTGAWVTLENRNIKQMVNLYSTDYGGPGQSAVAVTRLPIDGGYDACLAMDSKTGEAVIQARDASGKIHSVTGTELALIDMPRKE